MLILIMKIQQTILCILCRNCIHKNYIYFHNYLELNYKSFYFDVIPSHQYFHYILQLIYQLIFFYTYSFYNLNILQHHMIYCIHIHNYQDSNSILCCIFICQSILCIQICIYLHSIFIYCYKHLHLVYIYIYKFHATFCILFCKFLKSD